MNFYRRANITAQPANIPSSPSTLAACLAKRGVAGVFFDSTQTTAHHIGYAVAFGSFANHAL
jgi:hypothetical protein